MTSFQRLRNGLNVLDRYAGITSIELFNPDPDLTPCVLSISIPGSLTLDLRDRDKLAKLGWQVEERVCTFQP